MIKKDGNITVKGKIVEVRDGQRKVRRNFTYGYRVLRIQVGFEYYSVLVNAQKFNEYGFLPKVGQWIRVTGRLSQSKDDNYDPSISWISELEHIEPPDKMQVSTKEVLEALTIQWQNLSQVAALINVKSEAGERILKRKLDELTSRGAIVKLVKRDKPYWRFIKK